MANLSTRDGAVVKEAGTNKLSTRSGDVIKESVSVGGGTIIGPLAVSGHLVYQGPLVGGRLAVT